MTQLVLMVAVLGLLLHLVFERIVLRRLLRSWGADPQQEPMELALWLGGVIYTQTPRPADDPVFLLPVFAPLGGTPLTIFRRGGCCSGISRLYIACLDLLGIRAAQATLYHISGDAQHCLVEVTLPATRMLIDPTYGFAFYSKSGAPLGIEDLRAGAIPQFVPLPGSNRSTYPSDDYYWFAFADTRTANWTQTMVRRAVYTTIRRVGGDWIDRGRLPPLLEWPQVLLLAALGVIVAVGALVRGILPLANDLPQPLSFCWRYLAS